MKRKSINDELASIADVGANNWVCQSNIDSEMLTKLYESPEFVRYAVYSGDLILEHMIEQDGKYSKATLWANVAGNYR